MMNVIKNVIATAWIVFASAFTAFSIILSTAGAEAAFIVFVIVISALTGYGVTNVVILIKELAH